MKIKTNCLLAGLVIFMAIASWLYPATVKAAPLSYHDQWVWNHDIDISGSSSPVWIQLYFPNSTTRGTYSNGVFEYDNYVNQVNSFTITLKGTQDYYPNNPIHFYLDFDATHTSPATYSPLIASYPVNNNGANFTLTLDILNNALLYNGSNEGGLSWVTLNRFVGYETFYVGYQCHFTHLETDVDVGVNGGKVPEPTTMYLLGSGLLGLAGLRKKLRK